MKYINVDKLKEEIERRKQVHFDDYFIKKSGNPADYGASNALAQVLSFIDSLQQEQPEVDLEKEIDACWQNWLSPLNQKEVEGVLPKTEFAMYARHFYELRFNARKEDTK